MQIKATVSEIKDKAILIRVPAAIFEASKTLPRGVRSDVMRAALIAYLDLYADGVEGAAAVMNNAEMIRTLVEIAASSRAI